MVDMIERKSVRILERRRKTRRRGREVSCRRLLW